MNDYRKILKENIEICEEINSLKTKIIPKIKSSWNPELKLDELKKNRTIIEDVIDLVDSHIDSADDLLNFLELEKDKMAKDSAEYGAFCEMIAIVRMKREEIIFAAGPLYQRYDILDMQILMGD